MTLYLSGLTISTQSGQNPLIEDEILSYSGQDKNCIELSAHWIKKYKSQNDALMFLRRSNYEG